MNTSWKATGMILAAAVVVGGFLLAGCGDNPPPDPAANLAPGALAEAQKIFTSRCFTCHGMEGRGDGPASAGLNPPPRDLHLKDWQQSVSDEHIEKIIAFGGAAVGKSPAMPPNPDLSSKPEILKALTVYIRKLGEK